MNTTLTRFTSSLNRDSLGPLLLPFYEHIENNRLRISINMPYYEPSIKRLRERTGFVSSIGLWGLYPNDKPALLKELNNCGFFFQTSNTLEASPYFKPIEDDCFGFNWDRKDVVFSQKGITEKLIKEAKIETLGCLISYLHDVDLRFAHYVYKKLKELLTHKEKIKGSILDFISSLSCSPIISAIFDTQLLRQDAVFEILDLDTFDEIKTTKEYVIWVKLKEKTLIGQESDIVTERNNNELYFFSAQSGRGTVFPFGEIKTEIIQDFFLCLFPTKSKGI